MFPALMGILKLPKGQSVVFVAKNRPVDDNHRRPAVPMHLADARNSIQRDSLLHSGCGDSRDGFEMVVTLSSDAIVVAGRRAGKLEIHDDFDERAFAQHILALIAQRAAIVIEKCFQIGTGHARLDRLGFRERISQPLPVGDGGLLFRLVVAHEGTIFPNSSACSGAICCRCRRRNVHIRGKLYASNPYRPAADVQSEPNFRGRRLLQLVVAEFANSWFDFRKSTVPFIDKLLISKVEKCSFTVPGGPNRLGIQIEFQRLGFDGGKMLDKPIHILHVANCQAIRGIIVRTFRSEDRRSSSNFSEHVTSSRIASTPSGQPGSAEMGNSRTRGGSCRCVSRERILLSCRNKCRKQLKCNSFVSHRSRPHL